MSEKHEGERSELEQLLAAEALSANDVDAADRALLNKLLEDGELADELEDYREAAAQLAFATTPVAPPASMKSNLFAMLDDHPQQNPLAGESEDSAATTAAPNWQPIAELPEPVKDATAPARLAPVPPAQDVDGAGEHRGGGGQVAPAGPAEQRARGRWFRTTTQAMFAATAAVVVGVGLFVGGGFAFNGLGQGGGDPTETPQVVASELTQILAAPDVDKAHTQVEGGGTVTVYWSAELGQSAVVADGVGSLPTEKDYELWYIDEAGPAKAGIMTVNADGSASRVLEGSFAPGMAIGLTVEPKGGSDQPTTTPIAVVQSA